ncbi:MAG: hypothetical protein WC518_02195 [Patescibacteria group bacterium]
MPKRLPWGFDLLESEKINKIIRRSYWFWFWPLTLAAFLVIFDFFLLYPLFRQGKLGITIFAILIVLAVFLFLRIYWLHFFNAFILTNIRMIDIDQRGLMNRQISPILYDKVENVSCRKKGIKNYLFHQGDIYFSLLGSKRIKFKIPSVKKPELVVTAILLQQEEAIKQSQDAFKDLEKIKSKLGAEEFDKLIAE